MVVQAGALPLAVNLMGDNWSAVLPVSLVLTCSLMFRLQNTLAEPLLLMTGRLWAINIVAIVSAGAMVFGVATITLGGYSISALHLATLSALTSALSALIAWRSVYPSKGVFVPMATRAITKHGLRPAMLLAVLAFLVFSEAGSLESQVLIFGAAIVGAVYQLWAETRDLNRAALLHRVTGGRFVGAPGGKGH